MNIVTWLQTNWIGIVAALWSFDQFLKVVGAINPQLNWIDNLADGLGKILAQFFPKGQ